MSDYFKSKEVSWLSFNERVLQEAGDESVPLADRIKFLGIYSNNLDEFFRVKIANLIHLSKLEKIDPTRIRHSDPQAVLNLLEVEVDRQRERFDSLTNEIIEELEKSGIYIKKYGELTEDQERFVQEYFDTKVRSRIFPMIIDNRYKFPKLKDKALYLAVELFLSGGGKKYSIIEIPTKVLPRFLVLPSPPNEKHIIFIDEVVRFGLPSIFKMLSIAEYHSYNIKVTNDAGLDLEDDLSTSYLSKVSKSLKKRKQGPMVRFVYDKMIPEEMLSFLGKKLKLKKVQFQTAGGRYHYLKDFLTLSGMTLLKGEELHQPLEHKSLSGKDRIFEVLKRQDILLHFPFHSYNSIIDFLREASIDPQVESIKITLYRVAHYSSIVNALINALRNRKEVTVIVELQARFDEKSNIFWAEKLKEEGAKVIFGVSGMKVHSKLCMVTRLNQKKELDYFCSVGTGNFNEDTAKLYTDTYLLTSNREIGREVASVFSFLEQPFHLETHEHLLVSPVSNRQKIKRLIEVERDNALQGKKAFIYMKMNNFADRELGDAINDAADAGVDVKLIVRGMFTLYADKGEMHENIQAISIVDKYLEHSRFLIFCNDGDEKVYLTSADIQPRNLDRRIEVACPVLKRNLKKEMIDIFHIYWRDNVKARLLDNDLSNAYVAQDQNEPSRSQDEIYVYLKRIHKKSCPT